MEIDTCSFSLTHLLPAAVGSNAAYFQIMLVDYELRTRNHFRLNPNHHEIYE